MISSSSISSSDNYNSPNSLSPSDTGAKWSFNNKVNWANLLYRIQGIGSGTGAKDRLSVYDERVDGSLGGFGNTMEKIYKSERSVPIFEFRGLITPPTTGLEDFTDKVDKAIQELHERFAKAP